MLTMPPPPLLGATAFGNTPGWPCTFLGATHGPSALCALMASLPPWYRHGWSPEQHQAPQLTAMGGGERLALAPLGPRSRA